ncbi:Aldo/keto reductase [Auricularia subglabra TFB-10046 SS5]|nr:Aldo/keto reductase [Auricularia subglabra TFB-10046 SS5]
MKTAKLGPNGPEVSAIGFGLGSISYGYGQPISEEKAFELLDRAIELGCTFWDSSDMYGNNSETLKAYFEKTGNRDKVFLASKVGISREGGTPRARSDPEYVRTATDKLLERLGLPYVDLLYTHRLDANVPIEHTVSALAELVKTGKAKHIGLCECAAGTLRRAHAVHPIAAVQVEYSPFSLDIEDSRVGLLSACRELGIPVVAYSPLGRGMLGGRIRSRADLEPGDKRLLFPRYSEENFPKNLELVEKLKSLAEKKGVTIGQLTLAWVMAQGEDIIPIPGTANLARLEEDIGALEVNISNEEVHEVRDILRGVSGARGISGAMSESLLVDTRPL